MKREGLVLATALAAAALGLIAVRSAHASGPGTGGRRVRLNDEPAGPYLVRAVTSPTPPLVENLYVEVGVNSAATGKPLTDLEVVVLASPVGFEAPSLRESATHDIAPIPTEYAAHLLIPAAGTWRVTIQINGPDGPAEVEFLERVSNPTSIAGWIAVGAPLGGLALLIGIYLWLQRKQEKPSRPQ